MSQTKKTSALFPHSPRTYLIIGVVLIIGFFLGAQYQTYEEDYRENAEYRETKDTKKKKDNWKTYENDLYKFSVSYPSEWMHTNNTLMANNRYAVFAVSEEPETKRPAENSLLVLQPVAGRSKLKTWIDGTKNTEYVPDFTNSQIEYDDDGEEAVITQCQSRCTYYTYTYTDDQVFTMIITTEEEDDELVEKILSSLEVD